MRGTKTVWQRLRERGDGPGLSIALGLVVLLVGLIVFLVFGDNPWASGIQDKLDSGAKLTVEEGIIAGVWYAAAVNAGICVVLLASSWLWVGTTRLAQETRQREAEMAWRGGHGDAIGVLGSSATSGGGLWFWCLLIVVVVVAGWIRYPRLDDSFWNDEEQAFRKFTWGAYVVQDDPDGAFGETVETDRVKWDRSLYYTMSGNNHVVHTVGARIADSIWRRTGDHRESEFSEAVVRSGPFLAGLATIALLGLWLRSAGYPLVGVVAAALLALNPWHVRYSVEARGYSELLMWMLLANIALGAALGKGRWRWWVAYGVFQSLYLLCFPGAVYFAVAQNVIVVVVLLTRQDGGSLWRWLVANAIGAMLVVHMLLPALPRIQSWMAEQHETPFSVDREHLLDLWSHLSAGVPWTTVGAGLHHGVSVADLGAAGPWIFGLALPLLTLLGLSMAIAKKGRIAMFIFAAASAFGLIWLHNQITELAFYSWYHFYQLLVVVTGLAFVVELVRRRDSPESGRGKVSGQGKAAWLVALLTIFLYGFVTWAPRQRIRTFDRHPMRQVVEYVRGEVPALDAAQAGVMTAAIGPGKGQWHTYDPRVAMLSSAGDLTRLLEEAYENNEPLWIFCTDLRTERRDHADVLNVLDDERLFAKDALFKGLEEMWSIQIYRHKIRSAKAVPEPAKPPAPASKKPGEEPRPAPATPTPVSPDREIEAAAELDAGKVKDGSSGRPANGLQ